MITVQSVAEIEIKQIETLLMYRRVRNYIWFTRIANYELHVVILFFTLNDFFDCVPFSLFIKYSHLLSTVVADPEFDLTEGGRRKDLREYSVWGIKKSYVRVHRFFAFTAQM